MAVRDKLTSEILAMVAEGLKADHLLKRTATTICGRPFACAAAARKPSFRHLTLPHGSSMMQNGRLKFAAAYGRMSLSAVCAYWALILIAHYGLLVLKDPRDTSRDHAWKAVVTLYGLVGASGLLVIAALLVMGALFFAQQARRALSALRDEIGPDALDEMKLQKARDAAKTEGLLRGMPSHLGSVAAFRAQRRRLKVLLLLFVGVFACVGVAGLLGLLG